MGKNKFLPSQQSLKSNNFPWFLFSSNWFTRAEFLELSHILWVTLFQSCKKADVRPVRADALAHCYTSCVTVICVQGLNCHLMFSAGKSWVCDRDGDSGFNVWVAVTLNITHTTHIKQVSISVIVIRISLNSQLLLHYTVLSASCMLSHSMSYCSTPSYKTILLPKVGFS